MAEQIRTIHLTLLLLTLILIATGLGSQRGSFKRAYEDAARIENLLRHNDEFANAFLEEVKASASPIFTLDRSDPSKNAPTPFMNFAWQKDNRVSSIDRSGEFFFMSSFLKAAAMLDIRESRVLLDVNKLQDFIRLWDSSTVVIRNPLRNEKFTRALVVPSVCGTSLNLTPSMTAIDGQVYAEQIIYDPSKSETSLLLVRQQLKPAQEPCDFQLPMGRAFPIVYDIRSGLRRVARANWTLTPFAETFPDLTQTTKSLTSLEMPDLENHLLEEINREGEKVEMFGAKIPFELVGIVGSMILVGCQFYLWCHLAEFAARTRDGKEAEFTGYIGFYDDKVVIRFFTLMSTSMVPLGVLLYTAVHAYKQQLRWQIPALCTLISIFLGILLVREFIRVWAAKSVATTANSVDPEF